MCRILKLELTCTNLRHEYGRRAGVQRRHEGGEHELRCHVSVVRTRWPVRSVGWFLRGFILDNTSLAGDGRKFLRDLAKLRVKGALSIRHRPQVLFRSEVSSGSHEDV